jgi:hypothetical protein
MYPEFERPSHRVAFARMKMNWRAGLGVVLVLAGLIWTAQGLGYLAGSAMTGVTLWAIIGPIVAIIGVYLVAGAVRAGRP